MSIKIPDHIESLGFYKPGRGELKQAMEFSESSRAILCSNENLYGPSPTVFEALEKGFSQINHYPDASSKELIAQLSSLYNLPGENIIAGNGSDSLLHATFKAFTESGDEFLTSENSFSSVYLQAAQCNLKITQTKLTQGYGFDLDKLKDAVSSRTKIIYLCNPNNPTGTIIEAEELKAFISSVPSHVLILLDEAYFEYFREFDIGFEDTTNWVSLFNNLLIYRTFSKAYGLAGMRVGYCLGSKRLVTTLRKTRLPFEPGVLSQMAAIAAIKDQGYMRQICLYNYHFIHELYDHLDNHGISYIKTSANFILLTFQSDDVASDYNHHLVSKGVLARKCDVFGLANCIRVSSGTMYEMQVLMKALDYNSAA